MINGEKVFTQPVEGNKVTMKTLENSLLAKEMITQLLFVRSSIL